MKFNKKHIVLVCNLLLLWVGQFSFGQSEFSAIIKKTFKERPSTFTELDNAFTSYKRDTVKMKQLIAEAKKYEYLAAESYALNRMGIAYRNISQYKNAIAFHKEAINLAILANSNCLYIYGLNMEGVSYRRMDMPRSALDYHAKALQIANTIIDPEEDILKSKSVSLNSIGNIYLAMEQYELALEHFKLSLALEIKFNSKRGLAINYQNIGAAYEGLGNLDQALHHYMQSLAYNEQIDSDVGRSKCCNSIGLIYAKQGDYNSALKMIEEALDKAYRVNDQYYISNAHSSLGMINTEIYEFNVAKAHLDKAISIAYKHHLQSTEAEALIRRSKLHELRGDFEQSLWDYQEATKIKTNIINTQNINYVNDFDSKYHSELKTNRINALAQENALISDRFDRFRLFALTGLFVLGLIIFLGVSFINTRKLNNEKKILTLEQDILRAQMNPHFIFNSLNAIKLYIINNEKENAVYYLNKFSKLVRKILVASKEKNVSLEEELDTMELYMNIENIRFDNTINFHLKVDPLIAVKDIKVPSLFLQPFLENALWHGLSSKVGEKSICICISKINNSHIKFTVEDNGVGRAQANKNKDNILFKRKSVGISLTMERLDNFSKSYLDNYHFEIIDLKDDEGAPKGTRIVIDLPIHQNKLVAV
ncbi:MAG: tetratricopeptide repeat protein [bacterium]